MDYSNGGYFTNGGNNGKLREGAMKHIQVGDIVTCTLDMNEGTISFMNNGQD
jgi:hypothetical protein